MLELRPIKGFSVAFGGRGFLGGSGRVALNSGMFTGSDFFLYRKSTPFSFPRYAAGLRLGWRPGAGFMYPPQLPMTLDVVKILSRVYPKVLHVGGKSIGNLDLKSGCFAGGTGSSLIKLYALSSDIYYLIPGVCLVTTSSLGFYLSFEWVY